MNRKEIEAYGDAFFQAYQTHAQIDIPSLKHPDITYEEAYAIQRVLVEKLKANGMTIAGKKIGLTSQAMRKAANIYEPDYGFIFMEWGHFNGCELPRSAFIAPRIECELAFRLKHDLNKPNITPEDVVEATEYAMCCMEICDFRMFRDKAQRLVQDSIADDAAFGGYVLGDIALDIRGKDLSLIPYIFEVNNRQTEVSCGCAVYNDPVCSVAWLANTFYALGEPLKKGELILSGSAVASVPAESGDHFRCRFGEFGEVSCKFI